MNPESRTGKPMISPPQENTQHWDAIPAVLMGRSAPRNAGPASPVRLEWVAPSRVFFIASNNKVIRSCSEPAKNWDRDCTRRFRKPALACEWVEAGCNAVYSGPSRFIEIGTTGATGFIEDLIASPLSPHGCLVG